MTVGELITALEGFPKDAPVLVESENYLAVAIVIEELEAWRDDAGTYYYFKNNRKRDRVLCVLVSG